MRRFLLAIQIVKKEKNIFCSMIWTTVMCSTYEGMTSGGCQKPSSRQDSLQPLNDPHPPQFIDFVAILSRILCKGLLGK